MKSDEVYRIGFEIIDENNNYFEFTMADNDCG